MPKRVLVTGASRGVGRSLAAELLARGHEVVATARDTADLAGLDGAEPLELDVTSPESVRRAADAAGSVEVLVNNAGVGLSTPVERISPEILQRVWAVNVAGPVLLIQALLPGMRERGRGRIVTVSSVAGRRAMPFTGHYSATKHAIEALSESLRWEAADFGVDVVIVEPGTLATGFSKSRLDPGMDLGPYAELRERYNAAITPEEKVAVTPDDTAKLIADLIEAKQVPLRVAGSEQAAFMIGERTGRSDAEFEQWITGRIHPERN
jgi:NAD(P)-dependent dehydrogenase (short-subunit alcohol dehydrogenase family)